MKKCAGIFKLSTRWSQCSIRPQSSQADNSWLEGVLPSQNFLKSHVRNPVMKEKLSNRITELQFFQENTPNRKVPKLDDSSWLVFLSMNLPSERGRYLIELAKSEPAKEERASDLRLVSEINKERDDKGEMVYCPEFHRLIELAGGDFRKQLNSLFGSRLLAQERVEESLPKLIIDCRFMREYSIQTQSKFVGLIKHAHLANWNLRHPFQMNIANFAPDIQLADLIRKAWAFRFGTTGDVNFKPHPFAPTISSRGIRDVANCSPDDIMYISWRATQFLPEKPPKVKAVVLCAGNDGSPSTSSRTAAVKDGIQSYRIPVHMYQRIDHGRSAQLPLPQSVEVLSEYFSGNSIGTAIRKAFAERENKLPNKEKEENFIQKYTETCESLERNQNNQRKQREWLEKPTKRPRIHRYSREERRQSAV